MQTRHRREKAITRPPDTAISDQLSPARLAARKSLNTAIATANHYSTPRRGAKLREFLIYLLLRFICFSSIFVMLAASTLYDGSRTTATAAADANVSPTAWLDGKQTRVGCTVDRRKFVREHRRLDRMVVASAREHSDNPKPIGLTFLF